MAFDRVFGRTRGGVSRRLALALFAMLAASPALAQSDAPKKIGIVGAGKIGSTFAALWIKAGYDVLLSSRHPEELKDLADGLGPKAKVGTVAEAFGFGDAVLLAIPYKNYPAFGQENTALLKDKIVIDAGNPTKPRDGALFDEFQANGVPAMSRKYLPGARIVRAFNATSAETFKANAGRPAPRMAVPIAGDDPKAVAIAERLVGDAGFDPVAVGKLDDAQKFAMWTRGFGHVMSAPDLKEKLGVSP